MAPPTVPNELDRLLLRSADLYLAPSPVVRSKRAHLSPSFTRAPRVLSKARTPERLITICLTFLARNYSPWYSPTIKSSATFSRMLVHGAAFHSLEPLPGSQRPSRTVCHATLLFRHRHFLIP